MELTFRHFTSPQHMDAQSVDLLRSCSLMYGEAYDSMLNMEEDREVFLVPEIPGAITFCRVGKDAEMLGGLCAPSENKKEVCKNRQYDYISRIFLFGYFV